MNLFVSLLAIVSVTISISYSAVLNRNTILQPQIDDLLSQLQSTSMDAVLYWNLVTLEACANDYDTSVAAVPDQAGPTATSRAFAIIHGAMYDAMVVFNLAYKPVFKINNMPITNDVPNESGTNAAVMQAAYQTLYALYPKQRPIFDAIRADYIKQLKTDGNKKAGIAKGIIIGDLVSSFILAVRGQDGSQDTKVYTPKMLPGYHQPDPTHPNQGFLGANWGNVKPFLLNNASQFLPSKIVGDTPASRLVYLNSTKYVSDFLEIVSLGSKTSTIRTEDQTNIGIAWAYDGAPKIGVPPRLYNQIVRVIANQEKNTVQDNARLFALVNYALGDAGIACWQAKYYYELWRPIVGIRQATGYTSADPSWLPYGSPSDNSGTNFTPGFPSYVSGHATFGSACFETLRQFYKTDNIKFQFQSDEFNGKTIDSNTGKARPAKTRKYKSFTEAETENFLSRIYLGVHWRIDQEEGQILGHKVAQYGFNKLS